MALVHNPKLKGFDYTPIDQIGTDNPFKLKLKTINPRELVSLQDNLIARDETGMTIVKSGAYSVSVCLKGIVDWSGIIDSTGSPIDITLDTDGTIAAKSLDLIPVNYFEEVASVIVSVSLDPKSIKDVQRKS